VVDITDIAEQEIATSESVTIETAHKLLSEIERLRKENVSLLKRKIGSAA
jgi:hypothetical protein